MPGPHIDRAAVCPSPGDLICDTPLIAPPAAANAFTGLSVRGTYHKPFARSTGVDTQCARGRSLKAHPDDHAGGEYGQIRTRVDWLGIMAAGSSGRGRPRPYNPSSTHTSEAIRRQREALGERRRRCAPSSGIALRAAPPSGTRSCRPRGSDLRCRRKASGDDQGSAPIGIVQP